ncbi:MAG: LamG domain-containing protein, partial [Gammaproteobacteria bacterium]|nr:LamG domain-containing protein [Gammaproteobacteria bacterium]
MKHELPEGFCKDLVGYCDPISVRAGEKINFKFSAYVPGEASASIVRLISGDDRPHGTGLLEEEVVSIPEPLQLSEQPLLPGSFATVCDLPGVAQGTISFWFYPTLLRSNRQTMLSFGDLVIDVSTHGIHVVWKNAEIALEVNLQQRRWYHLNLSFGDEVDLVVKRIATNVAEQPAKWSAQKAIALRLTGGELLLAASGPNNACFNGRMEALSIMADNEQVACWDFSKSTETQNIVDVSGNHHHGQLHQTPTRAVCGVNWDGSEQNFQSAPEQYGAIHFHEDDLTDAGWTDTLV